MAQLFDLEPFHVDAAPAEARPDVLAEMESCLSLAVPAMGVVPRALGLVRERWQGLQPTIPKSGSSAFVEDIGFFVALAAVERGFAPAEAFVLWGVASEAVRLHYGPAQLYIPFAKNREERYKAMLSDISALGLVNAARVWGASYQHMRRLLSRHLTARRTARRAS